MSDLSDEIYMEDPRAKSIEGFIAGLTILAKYMPNGLQTKFAFGAGHEVLYIWGDVTLDVLPEDSQDGRTLLRLGFHTDDDIDQWQYFA